MTKSDPIRTIVSLLARIAVDEYLRAEAAKQQASERERSDHVPLPDDRKAA